MASQTPWKAGRPITYPTICCVYPTSIRKGFVSGFTGRSAGKLYFDQRLAGHKYDPGARALLKDSLITKGRKLKKIIYP